MEAGRRLFLEDDWVVSALADLGGGLMRALGVSEMRMAMNWVLVGGEGFCGRDESLGAALLVPCALPDAPLWMGA